MDNQNTDLTRVAEAIKERFGTKWVDTLSLRISGGKFVLSDDVAADLAKAAISAMPQGAVEVDANDHTMSGALVFKGTRMPVYLVADRLRDGAPDSEIKEAWPHVTDEQIEAVRRLVPSIAPTVGVPEWKPIETAPKDGTHFIGFNRNLGGADHIGAAEDDDPEDETPDEWAGMGYSDFGNN